MPNVIITFGNGADDIQKSTGPPNGNLVKHSEPNKKRSKCNTNGEINVNGCCVCFALYANDTGIGSKWLMLTMDS